MNGMAFLSGAMTGYNFVSGIRERKAKEKRLEEESRLRQEIFKLKKTNLGVDKTKTQLEVQKLTDELKRTKAQQTRTEMKMYGERSLTFLERFADGGYKDNNLLKMAADNPYMEQLVGKITSVRDLTDTDDDMVGGIVDSLNNGKYKKLNDNGTPDDTSDDRPWTVEDVLSSPRFKVFTDGDGKDSVVPLDKIFAASGLTTRLTKEKREQHNKEILAMMKHPGTTPKLGKEQVILNTIEEATKVVNDPSASDVDKAVAQAKIDMVNKLTGRKSNGSATEFEYNEINRLNEIVNNPKATPEQVTEAKRKLATMKSLTQTSSQAKDEQLAADVNTTVKDYPFEKLPDIFANGGLDKDALAKLEVVERHNSKNLTASDKMKLSGRASLLNQLGKGINLLDEADADSLGIGAQSALASLTKYVDSKGGAFGNLSDKEIHEAIVKMKADSTIKGVMADYIKLMSGTAASDTERSFLKTIMTGGDFTSKEGKLTYLKSFQSNLLDGINNDFKLLYTDAPATVYKAMESLNSTVKGEKKVIKDAGAEFEQFR